MEAVQFDRLTRSFATAIRRRTALAAAATGLVSISATSALAQQGQDSEVGADHHRRRRNPKRGKRGRQGPPGPPAGASVQFEVAECSVNPAEDDVGTSDLCSAECPDGFVAVGGGFFIDSLPNTLAIPRGSYPLIDGQGDPVAWIAEIEFIAFGQQFDYAAYALCLPTT